LFGLKLKKNGMVLRVLNLVSGRREWRRQRHIEYFNGKKGLIDEGSSLSENIPIRVL